MPFYKTTTFFVCLAVLAVFIVLSIYVLPRASAQTDGPRRPLVEFARSKDQNVKDRLSEALKWDFGLIPIYALGLSLLCFIVGRLANAPMRLTGWIIFVVVAASLFDVAENFSLLHVIKTSQDDAWATAARILEWLKLISPLTGLVYPLAIGFWGIVNAARR